MSFEAKYRGDCGNCFVSIEVGDEVDWLRVPGEKDLVIHVKCPDTVASAPTANEKRCPRCTSYHAGEC